MTHRRSVCVPNIGPKPRRQRLLGGLVAGAAAVAMAIVFIAGEVPRVTRILVAVPVFLAYLGALQFREST